jgi:hypothetical protein
MKLKILLAIVLVAGLVAGITPVLAATGSSNSGSANIADVEDILYEEDMEGWPDASDIPEACLEALPGELDAEPMLDDLDEATTEFYCGWTEGHREEGCHHRIPRVVLRSGVVTQIEENEDGDITHITILNRHAALLTFRILDSTIFYYEEGLSQELDEGDLVTVVRRPWRRIAQYEAECLPQPRWPAASAVVVHAPRECIIYGDVTGIDLEEEIISINSTQGDVKVRVNDDTRYIFLPRPNRILVADCDQANAEVDCIVNPPELGDILEGDRVVVYAPRVDDDGTRLAKVVVVLPRADLERVCGQVTNINEETHTITVNSCVDEAADQVDCEATFSYNELTVFVLHGKLSLEVGDQVTAWCFEDASGDLTAKRVVVR